MKINPFPALTALVLLAVLAATGRPDDAKPAPDNKLLGTWKLVSAKYGGKESKLPDSATTIKHVTATQFMWVTYDKDGKVSRTSGGTYTIKGEKYQETPAYGISSDFDLIKGKAQTFTWKVEGNKWYHTGKLSNDLTIEEVWERDEKR